MGLAVHPTQAVRTEKAFRPGAFGLAGLYFGRLHHFIEQHVWSGACVLVSVLDGDVNEVTPAAFSVLH